MSRGKKMKFPEMLVIMVSGPSDKPYFSIARNGVDDINKDQVVGVYRLKRVASVKVKRTLHKTD